MIFTAASVFRGAQRIAVELQNKPVDRNLVAENFHDALRDLIMDVVTIDEERLADSYELPSWVVNHDPINLGWYEAAEPVPITDALEREWLHIAYIDWAGANDKGNEVAIATLEARHRAANEYAGFITGYFTHQMRHLEKVGSWNGVTSLIVHGVLAPAPVTGKTLDTVQYDYPAALESALRWDLLNRLVTQPREDWMARRGEQRIRLIDDAKAHVTSRIEDQPLTGW